MDFKNLENSSTLIRNIFDDSNEEKIMDNVLQKINLLEFDFINNIINEIINNSIFDVSDVKKSKFERAELKLINKIYEKFEIQKIIEEPEIDLVYTYINYNDKNFIGNIKNFEMKSLDSNLLKNYKEEKRENFFNFLLNVEITKRNIPFVRNIYIITPNYDFIDEIDKYIVVPIEDIYCNDKYSKTYFRPNIIIQYLTEIKGLSNLFFFGTQEMIIAKNIKKDELFSSEVPLIYLKKKILNKDNVKDIEEYNASKLFEEKFDINLKCANINQLTLVRKDVLSFTKKLFNFNINVDFLLLQYFTGYFFYLYNLKTSNTHYNYFSINVQKLMTEKFNLLKFKNIDFFSINYLTNKIIPYYLHACLVNLDFIENKVVKNVFFLVDRNDKKIKYILPGIEKYIQNYAGSTIKFIIAYDDNIVECNGKFGECIYLVFGCPQKKWQHLKHIVIEMTENACLSDILFFLNVDSRSMNGERVNIFYPKKIVNKMEDKYEVPFSKILKMNNESGIKCCNIVFKVEASFEKN